MRESEEKYRGIFDESIAAVYLFDEKKNFLDSNQAGLDLLGYSREELLNMSIPDVDADPIVVLPAHEQLLGGERIINYEHRLNRKDGKVITVLNNSRPITDTNGHVIGMQSTLIDITERKQAEEALLKRKSELMLKSNHLEEVNAALKVLLKRREEDKLELGENVLANVKELVLPYLEKLKKSQSQPQQLTLLGIVESNLRDIVSPFATKLSSRYLNLTPTEVQVASLIRHGRTTKEIAALLHLSVNTIRSHRYNLRSKLGLKNRKINLRSYLRSLKDE
jgi:PAS domain S-box-containing protein